MAGAHVWQSGVIRGEVRLQNRILCVQQRREHAAGEGDARVLAYRFPPARQGLQAEVQQAPPRVLEHL